jgi:hypothetical protein
LWDTHLIEVQQLASQAPAAALADLGLSAVYPERLSTANSYRRSTPYNAEAALLFLCVNLREMRSLLSVKRAT